MRTADRGGRGAAPLIQVFLLAVVVRFVFASVVPPSPLMGDAIEYDRLAHAILDGQGYVSAAGLPTSDRPPLYGYFLAAVYGAFEDGPAIARILQAVIDAVTCALVYLLARRHFGVAAARVAALFAILSLSLLFAARHILTETLAAFFMVVIVAVLDWGLARWRWSAFIAAGALVGCSTLNKGTTLVLPIALMWPIWEAAERRWRPTIRAGVLVLAGFAAVLLPWTIRNYRVHGEFVPVATQVGYVIYSSYLPPEGKLFGVYTDDETTIAAMALPEVQRSRVLLHAAAAHVREHPDELPRLLLLKFLYFVSPFDWELLNGDGIFNFTYALALPFALYGLRIARPHGWKRLLLALPIGFLLALSLALYGSPRLRLPAEPLLMVFAGGGAMVAWQNAGSHRRAFAVVTVTMVLTGFAAYLFSAEVKSFSAQALRHVGAW